MLFAKLHFDHLTPKITQKNKNNSFIDASYIVICINHKYDIKTH